MSSKKYIAALGIITSMRLNICLASPIEQSPLTIHSKLKEINSEYITTLDNEKYKIACVKIPHPLEAESINFIKNWAGKKDITIYKSTSPDRYGRYSAVFKDTNEETLQNKLLSTGMAFVYLDSNCKNDVEKFKKLENLARNTKQGLWNKKYQLVKSPEETQNLINSYQLVEGTVEKISYTKDSVYLNFGENWKEDFTARFPKKKNKDYSEWVNKKVLIRGWIENYYGPFINIANSFQIEVVSEQK